MTKIPQKKATKVSIRFNKEVPNRISIILSLRYAVFLHSNIATKQPHRILSPRSFTCLWIMV